MTSDPRPIRAGRVQVAAAAAAPAYDPGAATIRAAVLRHCGGFDGVDDETLLRHWRSLPAELRAAWLAETTG